jgi:hypothetical protein
MKCVASSSSSSFNYAAELIILMEYIQWMTAMGQRRCSPNKGIMFQDKRQRIK